MLKILFLGEIIGLPTVKQIEKKIPKILDENKFDLIMANADGASDGYGLLTRTAYSLYNSGIKVITCGDCIFNKKDVKNLLKSRFLLRPFNLPSTFGGKGSMVYNINENVKIGIINILGRYNFHKIYASDPFYAVQKALDKFNDDVKVIIVDFHGGTTSEIQAMHWHLSGKVSLVAGTHLRVLTSDNRIINNKTAVITGLGYCGGYYSIGGLLPDIEIKKIKYGKFLYSKVVKDKITLKGIILNVDENTGNAESIELYKNEI